MNRKQPRIPQASAVGVCQISDPFLSLALGYPSVNPIYLEKWLVRIHKYEPWEEKESIRECIERVYGKEWADLAGRLI